MAADGGWYAWRLSSANHRELGRGVAVHASLESVLAALVHLRTNAVRAAISYAIGPSGGLWTWRLTIDAVPTATSSRAYFRQREAAYAAAAFLAAVTVAAIPTVAKAYTKAGHCQSVMASSPRGSLVPHGPMPLRCE